MTPRRRLGGTFFGGWMVAGGSTGIRCSVYDLGDRLEIEERDHWMITRRRIPLRDVVLITHHRFRRIGTALIALVPTLLFSALAVAVVGDSGVGALLIAAFLVAPFLTLSLWSILVPITEVQIQSRRVTARMRFGLRAAQGDALRRSLEERVRAAQEEATAASVVPPPIPLVTP